MSDEDLSKFISITQTFQLKDILAEHALWLMSKQGGNRAYLCGANLSGINLNKVDLSRANLNGVNLTGASLFGANLSWANLTDANLSGADLREANLSRADLTNTNLSEANLSEANLSRVYGVTYAQCSFDAHGERGRQLSGIVINETLRLFCDCFRGTLAELDAYIVSGDERYKASRKLARDFIVTAIDAARKEQP